MNSFEKQTTRSGSRRMAFLCALVFSLGAVFGMLAGGVHRLSASSSMTDAPAFAIFEETWNLVQERYVLPEELDETDLIYGAARGMVEAVGDTGHSAFLDPVEAQSFRASLNGELIGVGIRIEFNGEYPQVIAPIDGSPAESAGIESGDFILKIDGRDTAE
ncbi:MAG: S41 family peptidase [Thermomicrobiales bacterium]